MVRHHPAATSDHAPITSYPPSSAGATCSAKQIFHRKRKKDDYDYHDDEEDAAAAVDDDDGLVLGGSRQQMSRATPSLWTATLQVEPSSSSPAQGYLGDILRISWGYLDSYSASRALVIIISITTSISISIIICISTSITIRIGISICIGIKRRSPDPQSTVSKNPTQKTICLNCLLIPSLENSSKQKQKSTAKSTLSPWSSLYSYTFII